MSTEDKRTVYGLGLGIMIPILYAGIQIAAAPFYPGYSFLSQDASTLGSDGSSLPWIFNGGAILLGLVKMMVAWAFLRGFRRIGSNPIVAWLISVSLVLSGIASINAGLFPAPDPRHTGSVLALLGGGTLLLPVLLLAAWWNVREAGPIRTYLIANLVFLIALIPVMSGLIQRVSIQAGIEIPGYQHLLNNYQGLIQRSLAGIVFVPIGVAAYVLAKRVKGATSGGLVGAN